MSYNLQTTWFYIHEPHLTSSTERCILPQNGRIISLSEIMLKCDHAVVSVPIHFYTSDSVAKSTVTILMVIHMGTEWSGKMEPQQVALLPLTTRAYKRLELSSVTGETYHSMKTSSINTHRYTQLHTYSQGILVSYCTHI